MQAAAIKHRDIIVHADDHQIHFTDNGIFWLAVFQVTKFGDGNFIHFGSLSIDRLFITIRLFSFFGGTGIVC